MQVQENFKSKMGLKTEMNTIISNYPELPTLDMMVNGMNYPVLAPVLQWPSKPVHLIHSYKKRSYKKH